MSKAKIPQEMIVRTVEKINQEYSDINLKLGAFVIEEGDIQHAEQRQATRLAEINELKMKAIERVLELRVEMGLAQEHAKRKTEETPSAPGYTNFTNEPNYTTPDQVSP